METKITELKALLARIPSDVSVLISGPPGIGKTDLSIQLAQQFGCRFKVFLAATMDPTDLVGVPFPIEAKKATVFYPPEDLVALTEHAEDKSPMVVCFDDITTANDHVFAALFRLFQHREVAGLKIRDNVRLYATGNRVQDKAAARDLPTALNNRFIHFDLNVDPDAWRLWAFEHGIQPSIVAYIMARPDKLHQFNPANTDRAFATPRSVAMASRLQEAIGINNPQLFLAIGSCVGEAWATEYQAFLKNTEHLVKPEDIMKDPEGCKVPGKNQIDVMFATISSLIYYVSKNPTTQNCLNSFVYSQRMPTPDMGIVLVDSILKAVVKPSKDSKFKLSVINDKAFSKILEKHGYVLDQN